MPQLQDVATTLKLLRQMGVAAERDGATVRLKADAVTHTEAPYEMVKTMRASILVLGPLVGRFGRPDVSLPGGCAIGARPVDQHIKGLELMGARIHVDGGYLVAEAARLKGTRIVTDMVTVTGTENLMMAGTLADGDTVIEKLDPSGALIWDSVYGLAGFRVEVGSDNQAVVSGFPNAGTVGAAFIKVDEAGTLVWSNFDADGPLGLLAHAHMLLDGANNAYLAAGTMSEMAVCKVNSDGAA